MVREIGAPTVEQEMDLYFQDRTSGLLLDERQDAGNGEVYLNALPWEMMPSSYNDYKRLH